MISKSKVAVIMSVYKNDNLNDFTRAVESILAQTYSCHLLIYQDGPLNPKVAQAIEKFSHNPSIKLFSSSQNNGLAYCLNKMIDFCLTSDYKYIARMDSDDISRPHRIERQVNFLETNSHIHVLGSFCKEFGASFCLKVKKLPTEHDELINFSITRSPFIHPTVMFRSSIFKVGYRYPEDTILTEDMALWFNLLHAGYIFHNIDEVLLDFQINEETINRRIGYKKSIGEFKIRFKNMIALKKTSLKNLFLIFTKLALSFSPLFVIKAAYKNLR
ncbi:glycosyltransferase [Providencia rettgeri]|uniref:glycosyltransferase n=1 Tax=Providencia rettgeri TaxID=587 RepID=UPI001E41BF1D|nr:glycosyltransferase [Providencia rettgeri]